MKLGSLGWPSDWYNGILPLPSGFPSGFKSHKEIFCDPWVAWPTQIILTGYRYTIIKKKRKKKKEDMRLKMQITQFYYNTTVNS